MSFGSFNVSYIYQNNKNLQKIKSGVNDQAFKYLSYLNYKAAVNSFFHIKFNRYLHNYKNFAEF